MNTKTKRRMAAVTGLIIVVAILILAIVGGSSSAKSVSVAEALSGDYAEEKIKVSGSVVDNSYSTEGNVLTFSIYDSEGDESEQLTVTYEGGASATFGNGVTAICTGVISADGVLSASELVTQCPSKYESSTDALTVSQFIEYGDEVLDKTVKITGSVKADTLVPAGEGDRFVLVDTEGAEEVAVLFDDALSDEIEEGSILVLTGSLNSEGKFVATEVALQA